MIPDPEDKPIEQFQCFGSRRKMEAVADIVVKVGMEHFHAEYYFIMPCVHASALVEMVEIAGVNAAASFPWNVTSLIL